MGKTALALQFAIANAQDKQPAAVFSLEMKGEELGQRALAHIGSIDATKLRSGRLDPSDWTQLSAAIGRLTEIPLIIDGSPRASVERIRARCKRIKRRYGLRLVVIDYLQLMDCSAGDQRREQVEYISRNLKLMANELGVPVIALSQLNRALEARPNKRPMMSDLRESGALEQDADLILFVYRDEVYSPETTDAPGIAEVIIAKQRDGKPGTVYTEFHGEFNAFLESDWRPAKPDDIKPAKRKTVAESIDA
jgi:replicative DNA helicase